VSPWTDLEGDQEIILPVLSVKLRSDRLKLGTDFLEALVRLKYEDLSRRFQTQHEFFLTKENAQAVWLVPRLDSNLQDYKYSMTLFKASGEPVEVPERDGSGANLILMPPVIPPV
jgi:hypothetical protein